MKSKKDSWNQIVVSEKENPSSVTKKSVYKSYWIPTYEYVWFMHG